MRLPRVLAGVLANPKLVDILGPSTDSPDSALELD